MALKDEKSEDSFMSAGGGRSKISKHKARGTMDELEIIRLVLLDNRPLFMKVLDKVKFMKAQAEAFKNAQQAKK